jgi:hypothetical protein
MGLRETINDNSRLTITIVAIAAMLATGFVVMQVMAGRRTTPGKLPDTFYTDDDGQTFFKASGDNIAPFDHSGKKAVVAYVFECCEKRYVGFMERYNSDAHKLKSAGKSTRETDMFGRELKKPGSPDWIKAHDDLAASKVVDVRCPHGKNASPEPVVP